MNRRLLAWVEGTYHHAAHRGLGGDSPLARWELVGGNVRYPGPGTDLRRIFLQRLRRVVARDGTVSVAGTRYEVADTSLVGRKVVLLRDPEAPPERGLEVRHEGRDAGRATLLDLEANARRGDPARDTRAPAPLALRELGPGKEDPPCTDSDSG